MKFLFNFTIFLLIPTVYSFINDLGFLSLGFWELGADLTDSTSTQNHAYIAQNT